MKILELLGVLWVYPSPCNENGSLCQYFNVHSHKTEHSRFLRKMVGVIRKSDQTKHTHTPPPNNFNMLSFP